MRSAGPLVSVAMMNYNWLKVLTELQLRVCGLCPAIFPLFFNISPSILVLGSVTLVPKSCVLLV